MKNKQIPISYIVRAQHLYVNIFAMEDGLDYTPREYGACVRAYREYLEKMFLDDTETAHNLDSLFNQGIIIPGSFKIYCDYLRSRGYEIISRDNATYQEHEQCMKNCVLAWKKWKTQLKTQNKK